MRFETQNIFFIADFHIGHKNVIRFDNRPFKDINEMHTALIDNWNRVVGEDDIVFFLGDWHYKCSAKYSTWFAHQLNGTIHFILGNHDRYNEISKMNRFTTIDNEKKIDIKDPDVKGGYQHFHLHHHPIISWNKSYHGAIHLHGHVHQKMTLNKDWDWYYKRKVMDVGCNGIDYTPISYAQIKEVMNNKIVGPDGEEI